MNQILKKYIKTSVLRFKNKSLLLKTNANYLPALKTLVIKEFIPSILNQQNKLKNLINDSSRFYKNKNAVCKIDRLPYNLRLFSFNFELNPDK